MQTVAIYSIEDKMTAHRQKADEAYQVGKGLTPVAAYLAQDDIIRIALEHGVDMIHPGWVQVLQVPTYQPGLNELNDISHPV
jgi:pyruvate carboxylase